jgi:hypothetical protein
MLLTVSPNGKVQIFNHGDNMENLALASLFPEKDYRNQEEQKAAQKEVSSSSSSSSSNRLPDTKEDGLEVLSTATIMNDALYSVRAHTLKNYDAGDGIKGKFPFGNWKKKGPDGKFITGEVVVDENVDVDTKYEHISLDSTARKQMMPFLLYLRQALYKGEPPTIDFDSSDEDDLTIVL